MRVSIRMAQLDYLRSLNVLGNLWQRPAMSDYFPHVVADMISCFATETTLTPED